MSGKISDYEQGATTSRNLQRQMEAAGRPDIARLHGEAVDANLDRINDLKQQDAS